MAWSVPNEKMNTTNVGACAVINSLWLERLYHTPKKSKASLSKVQAFKFILHNAASKLRFSKLQSSKSNLRFSVANLFNFKFSNTCWKSPKLYQRSLAHFEKMSLTRWLWAFFWKKVLCLVKWAKTNAFSSIRKMKADEIAKHFFFAKKSSKSTRQNNFFKMSQTSFI